MPLHERGVGCCRKLQASDYDLLEKDASSDLRKAPEWQSRYREQRTQMAATCQGVGRVSQQTAEMSLVTLNTVV